MVISWRSVCPAFVYSSTSISFHWPTWGEINWNSFHISFVFLPMQFISSGRVRHSKALEGAWKKFIGALTTSKLTNSHYWFLMANTKICGSSAKNWKRAINIFTISHFHILPPCDGRRETMNFSSLALIS